MFLVFYFWLNEILYVTFRQSSPGARACVHRAAQHVPRASKWVCGDLINAISWQMLPGPIWCRMKILVNTNQGVSQIPSCVPSLWGVWNDCCCSPNEQMGEEALMILLNLGRLRAAGKVQFSRQAKYMWNMLTIQMNKTLILILVYLVAWKSTAACRVPAAVYFSALQRNLI